MHGVIAFVLLILGLAVAAGIGLCMMNPGLDIIPTLGKSVVTGVGVVVGIPILILLLAFSQGGGGSSSGGFDGG